jgi:hypothetical protein
MKKQYFFYACCLWLFCTIDCAFAVQARGPSYGDIADNLLGPLTGIISMVRAISIIAGIGLILSSFVKFGDYRKNHREISLALVITIFAAGGCLVMVGFIPFKGM